ncbi:MAG: hypothetical protein KKI02_02665, partial [Planctomycetes bacterium]|nr:hypothetical protein [Planctomycetota bacterium]
MLHVIGSDTPLCRLEALRVLYARPELGRQRVVRFGGGHLDCRGLGTVELVCVPFAVGRLARPALRDMLPTVGPTIVHAWSGVALPWASAWRGCRLLIDLGLPQDLDWLAERLGQLSSSVMTRFVCPTETARRRLGAIGVASGACVLIRDSVDFTG